MIGSLSQADHVLHTLRQAQLIAELWRSLIATSDDPETIRDLEDLLAARLVAAQTALTRARFLARGVVP